MKRDILDLWSLVMALIEYVGRNQLFVSLGPIYQPGICIVSREFVIVHKKRLVFLMNLMTRYSETDFR